MIGRLGQGLAGQNVGLGVHKNGRILFAYKFQFNLSCRLCSVKVVVLEIHFHTIHLVSTLYLFIRFFSLIA